MVNSKARFTTFVMVPCAITLLLALHVAAQQQVGDGRGLDANLQIGSGGVNQPGARVGYLRGNDIITGNVPGLGYFHGSVPYKAGNEFRGTLGSDTLFRFQARSLPVPQALGTTYIPGTQQSPVSVYRTFSSVPSQAGVPIGQSRLTTPATPYNSAGVVVYTPAQAYSSPASSMRRNDQPVGVYTQPDGRLLELSASPLLGLRGREVDAARLTTGRTDSVESDADEPELRPPSPYDLQQPDEQEEPAPLRSSLLPPPKPTARATRLIVGTRPIVVPVVPLGTHSMVQAPDAVTTSQAYEDLLAKIEQSRKQARDNADKSKSILSLPGVDLRPRALPSGSPTVEVPKPVQLKAPTPQQLDYAHTARRTAQQGQHDSPNDTKRADQTQAMHAILQKLNFTLPPVATLADNKDTQVDQIMRRAQDELTAGRYMDSQEHYRQALWLRPSDPMARVGMVHAQIGAGMFLSAHLNLRTLLERHPELIKVQYQPHLLPRAQQLDWVRDQLVDLIETTQEPGPPLLLAYLGYQTQSPVVTEYALDLAAARDTEDTLTKLLRTVWLEEQQQ